MPESIRDTRERVRALLAAAAADVESDVALERLRTIRQVRQALDAVEASAMFSAREAGTDWSEIGAALGMSGQAAGKRSRQRHQLTDPRTDAATGRPRSRGAYRPRAPRGDGRPRASATTPTEALDVSDVAPEPAAQPSHAEPTADAQPTPSGRGRTTAGRRKKRGAYTISEIDAHELRPLGETGSYEVVIAGDVLGRISRSARPRGWQAYAAATTIPVPHSGRGRVAATRQQAVIDLLLHLNIHGK
ncbi:hypothetical protein ACWDKQ_34565 [Saccharopolyspora sp. NPDC000995]